MVRHCIPFFLLGMLAWGMASCHDDNQEEYYVRMGVTQTNASTGEKTDSLIAEGYVWDAPKDGDVKSFFLYSNLPQWAIQVEPASSWVEVWPGTGGRDGRFYVKVYANESSEERTSTLQLISGGEVYGKVSIIQH